MLRTFNCGFGMVAVSRAAEAGDEAMRGACTPRGSARADRRADRARRRRASSCAGTAGAVSRRFASAVLISGRGSNMAALIAAARAPEFPGGIALVVSNKSPTPPGWLSRAAGDCDRGGRSRTFAEPRRVRGAAAGDAGGSRRSNSSASPASCASRRPVRRSLARADDQHPPSAAAGLSGLHTHERALADGVREHGCTVHFVDPSSTPGRSSHRRRFACAATTPETLGARVLAQEHGSIRARWRWWRRGRRGWWWAGGFGRRTGGGGCAGLAGRALTRWVAVGVFLTFPERPATVS